MLFGGRVSYSGLDPLGTTRATRQRMLNVFPQLADVEIEYAWGGMIDITMSRLPNFGRLEPNVYYLQGFSGHGMVATTIAGRMAAEAIAGQVERFDVMARIRHHDFPGGRLLRRPTLVMAMTWFRLRDLLP
jgi:gamma-glutamylputrescine oxidase